MARFAAVIFDMDGVLVDGEPLHFEAINTLLAEEGRSLTLEQYKPYMGTKAGWREMVHDFDLRHPYDYYRPRYHELILQQYRCHSAALPGARELVLSLTGAGLPIAVASSSVLPWVDACLERIDLLDVFDAIVTGSDVKEGKPHPEIYLLAASRLGVDPVDCLALEDAPAGIESAHNAGMECWAVRTPYTRGLLLPNPARELESLTEIHPFDILGVPV